ncbi:response regulator transcription factor [Paludibaculum fermentans]|uniref:Response regulator transcription factor n=2 Tax=Paludibaculum fermentans TaxID=1473598 RepID=A0A7S7NYH0_PALFE|nr:response regulator transcription factor [Paludibaculum fermentans]
MQNAQWKCDPSARTSAGARFQDAPCQRQQGFDVAYLVEDDPSVREALGELFASNGILHVPFSSAAEFLRCVRNDTTACLILDVRLPDMNGLELQRKLGSEGAPPIVFISGYGDIPSIIQAFKAGAMEFLTKPVNPQLLLPAVRAAFDLDRERRRSTAARMELQRRFSRLTPREREVFPLIIGGMLNKQAAAHLGITEVTLQVHRGQIMRKMQAESFADLVRMAGVLGIPGPDSVQAG